MGPGHDDVDRRVTTAFVAGGDDGLAQAYDRWGALVFTYCVRSLGDRAQAADVTQETFLAAWRSRPRFDTSRGTLPGWLLGIARFKVLEARRRAVATPRPVDGPGPTPTVAGAEDGLAERLLVAQALASLPDRPRAVLEQTFYAQRTQTEIAAELDLPLGTVKSDLRRGLAALRAHLHGLGEWGSDG